MYRRTRSLIHRWILKPLVRRFLRLEVNGGRALQRPGPAIVIANHNSHVDTAVLLAAFPAVERVRPVAAADYFLRNGLLAWFSLRIVGILPLDRRRDTVGDPLAGVSAALEAGEWVILYPEGTRGEPGVLGDFKPGIARLAARHPEVPVIPVWLEGCDRVLPRGSKLLRSHPCSVTVGDSVFRRAGETVAEYLHRLRHVTLELGSRRVMAA